jgi:ankyrin repeat protein
MMVPQLPSLSASGENEAFFEAARQGESATVQACLNAGVDVNATDSSEASIPPGLANWYKDGGLKFIESVGSRKLGRTALIWAARFGRTEVVDLLLKAGADVRKRDHVRFSALMAGVVSGSIGTVERLLAAGAPLNDKDRRGDTALMFATKANHLAIVDALLASGADANLRCSHG